MKIAFYKESDVYEMNVKKGGVDYVKIKRFVLILKVRKDYYDKVKFNLKKEGRMRVNRVK